MVVCAPSVSSEGIPRQPTTDRLFPTTPPPPLTHNTRRRQRMDWWERGYWARSLLEMSHSCIYRPPQPSLHCYREWTTMSGKAFFLLCFSHRSPLTAFVEEGSFIHYYVDIRIVVVFRYSQRFHHLMDNRQAWVVVVGSCDAGEY